MTANMTPRPPHRLILAIAMLLSLLAPRVHAAPTSQPFAGNSGTYPNGLSFAQQSNLAIAHLNVTGGALYVGNVNGTSGAGSIDIGNCTFSNGANITFPFGVHDIRIHDCHWINGPAATGINGNVPVGIYVENNTSSNYLEWLHFFGGFGGHAHGDIKGNTVTGGARNDIEVQEQWDNLDVADNSVTQRQKALNGAGMLYSIATGAKIPYDGSGDTHSVWFHDNIGDLSNVQASQKWATACVEFMGNGGRVDHNFLKGGNYACVYTETNMTQPNPGWTFTNNTISDCNNVITPESDGISGSTIIPPLPSTTNIVTTGAATPTIAQWAGVAAAQSSQPTVVNALAATVTSDTTATLTNVTAGTLAIITTGNGATAATLQVSAGTVNITNLHSGWRYSYLNNGATATALQTGSSTAAYAGVPAIARTLVKTTTIQEFSDGTTTTTTVP